MKIRVVVIAALVASTVSVPVAEASHGSLVPRTLGSRSFLEYVPATGTGPRPLIIELHGGSQTAAIITQPDYAPRGWMDVADDHGPIVVYPDGSQEFWNDCRTNDGTSGNPDDAGFLRNLIADVDARHNIDNSRVYVTGASSGGMMAYRMAFESANLIAAIGAVSASLATPASMNACGTTSGTISVAIMNGTDDAWMPYGGGPIAKDAAAFGTARPAEDTRNYWRNQVGLGSTNPQIQTYNTKLDGSSVERQLYTGGTNGEEVAFYKVVNGGHRRPSDLYRRDAPNDFLLGRKNRDIEYYDHLWWFFSRHSL